MGGGRGALYASIHALSSSCLSFLFLFLPPPCLRVKKSVSTNIPPYTIKTSLPPNWYKSGKTPNERRERERERGKKAKENIRYNITIFI